jgi:hypothetical protein
MASSGARGCTALERELSAIAGHTRAAFKVKGCPSGRGGWACARLGACERGKRLPSGSRRSSSSPAYAYWPGGSVRSNQSRSSSFASSPGLLAPSRRSGAWQSSVSNPVSVRQRRSTAATSIATISAHWRSSDPFGIELFIDCKNSRCVGRTSFSARNRTPFATTSAISVVADRGRLDCPASGV